MQIYLPIAEMSVNIFLILGLGGGVGVLSGLFGVGGGFLMTPLLFFIGIPSPVAVATEANQIVASSVSGVLAHFRRNNVDVKMGVVLLVGGVLGSTLGVWLFTYLKGLGQIDLVIKLSYVVFLSIIGGLMLIESLRSMSKKKKAIKTKAHHHNWMHGLPFKMRFHKSRLYISALLPIAIGFFVGILAAIMGVGGGFIMVPAMIYLLGMPTSVVVGTSLLQAVNNQTVDVVLAMLLMFGGVIGAQFGAKFGSRLQGEHLRGLLALIVLIVCAKLGYDLINMPDELYSLGGSAGH